MHLTSTKEEFLSNQKKQKFITVLAEFLEKQKCRCLRAKGDADLQIARTDIDYSTHHDTSVIGEDTDLLILLGERCTS
jgi:hypothetical protein